MISYCGFKNGSKRRYFLCMHNHITVDCEPEELVKLAYHVYPESVRRDASGKHNELPWEIDSVFLVPCDDISGSKAVAYLWREAE